MLLILKSSSIFFPTLLNQLIDIRTLRTILHPVGRSDENEMTVSDATVEYTWDGEDEGLYLAFLDTGSCSSLMNIEVWTVIYWDREREDSLSH